MDDIPILIQQVTEAKTSRITIVMNTMSRGGIKRMHVNFAIALAERGYNVDLYLLRPKGLFLLESLPRSIRIIALNLSVWTSFWYRLRRLSTYHIPVSLLVYFFGPRWIGRWIAWLRVIIAVKWSRKHFGLLRYDLAVAALGLSDYLRYERPDVMLGQYSTLTLKLPSFWLKN